MLERQVGFALISTVGRVTSTVVVFAEPGDRVLLGAHGLSGLNLRVDFVRKALVDAGPVTAAATCAA